MTKSEANRGSVSVRIAAVSRISELLPRKLHALSSISMEHGNHPYIDQHFRRNVLESMRMPGYAL
ncbi:hypothetical protein FE784_16920 [Paenibacillus hemerocallicola]|uniref:Uncharacterized protein n=1 Tax=Paenibacillus hemerocallicola TaxID=1172614 RepID=A0A5C4T7P0_9BACL|nr:hypothetical protein [Paenibacillus hemerocallicola]TNJ65068.1 hypothetical protein FE784_16920 [Paenibacillus hemerocallicola]